MLTKKSEFIGIKVTPAQRERFEEAAKAAQRTLADWLRQAGESIAGSTGVNLINPKQPLETLSPKVLVGFQTQPSAAAQRAAVQKKRMEEADACLAKATEYFAKINQ